MSNINAPIPASLVVITAHFPVQKVWLGHKPPFADDPKKVGSDKWIPPGGKFEVDEDEDMIACAIRETLGETGFTLDRSALREVGRLQGFMRPSATELLWDVVIYHAEVPRDAKLTALEGFDDGRWFALEEIPWDDMMPNDREWLPRVLKGEVLGTFRAHIKKE